MIKYLKQLKTKLQPKYNLYLEATKEECNLKYLDFRKNGYISSQQI